MGSHEEPAARAIPAVVLIHQEGVIGVIALVGLSLREKGVWGGLAPRGSLASGVIAGMVAGAICAGGLWMLRRLPALADLEAWQQQMVRDWSVVDAIVVAVFSGVAEEALIRALLQPIIGLLPAAFLFAALHIVPDRRLWLWPILACALGVGDDFRFRRLPGCRCRPHRNQCIRAAPVAANSDGVRQGRCRVHWCVQ